MPKPTLVTKSPDRYQTGLRVPWCAPSQPEVLCSAPALRPPKRLPPPNHQESCQRHGEFPRGERGQTHPGGETDALRKILAEFYANRALTKTRGTLRDQAEVAYLLASDRLGKTTGQMIDGDGGLLLCRPGRPVRFNVLR